MKRAAEENVRCGPTESWARDCFERERHRDLRKRIGMVFEHAALMMYPRLIFCEATEVVEEGDDDDDDEEADMTENRLTKHKQRSQ